jgi:hypothetical protein
MHAYQIWIALFLQLSEKQQNYHLDLAFKQNIDIPLITTTHWVTIFLVVISAGSMPIFTTRIKMNLRLELMRKIIPTNSPSGFKRSKGLTVFRITSLNSWLRYHRTLAK